MHPNKEIETAQLLLGYSLDRKIYLIIAQSFMKHFRALESLVRHVEGSSRTSTNFDIKDYCKVRLQCFIMCVLAIRRLILAGHFAFCHDEK